MGDDTLMYRAYCVKTGEQLGGCYDFDGVGQICTILFFEKGIVPADIRFERVKGE
ncbi:hypothetical protein vBPpSSYP_124 [Pseudomonas phage vB_PpS_SYP]|nr:hypothetical protein vBPpSSYP_124 [Pseudomonas phage vB_PpS_SYP]